MYDLIGDGRNDRTVHGIGYRADEKSLFIPVDLSKEELEELDLEIRKIRERVETNCLGIKITVGKYENVCLHPRILGYERKLSIDGFTYGCTINTLKKLAEEVLKIGLIRKKLGEVWGASDEETLKKIDELFKKRFF